MASHLLEGLRPNDLPCLVQPRGDLTHGQILNWSPGPLSGCWSRYALLTFCAAMGGHGTLVALLRTVLNPRSPQNALTTFSDTEEAQDYSWIV